MKNKTLLLLLFACACTSVHAQLSTSSATINLGEVGWHSPKTQEITFQNKTHHAVMITDVKTDCACTTAEWTRGQIIDAGEKANIRLTFDAQMLGHFKKSVRVYTEYKGKTQVKEVWLEGRVVAELTNFEAFPYDIGEGIHLSSSTIEFDDVRNGDTPRQTIGVVNSTKKSYVPTLMHMPSWLTAECNPTIIRPGRTGTITFTADASKVGRYGLAQTSIYVSRHMGDKVGKDNEVQVSLTLVPQVSVSPAALVVAPKAVADTVLTLVPGSGRKANKSTGVMTIQNAGRSDLEISRLQVYNAGLQVSLNKSVIKAGQEATMKVSLQTDKLPQYKGRLRILLITNDPERPTITVDVK